MDYDEFLNENENSEENQSSSMSYEDYIKNVVEPTVKSSFWGMDIFYPKRVKIYRLKLKGKTKFPQ